MTETNVPRPTSAETTQPLYLLRPCRHCGRQITVYTARCRWCGRPTGTGAGTDVSPAALVGRYALPAGLIIGGVLVAVSPVLPWVRVLFGGLNLFTIAGFGPSGGIPLMLFPIALVVTGAAAIVTALLGGRRGAVYIATGVLVLIAAILGVFWAVVAGSAGSGTSGLVGPGAGIWMDLVGAFLMVVGAGVSFHFRERLPEAERGRAALGNPAILLSGTGFAVVCAILGLAALGGALHTGATGSSAASEPQFFSPTAPTAPQQQPQYVQPTQPYTPPPQPPTITVAPPAPAEPLVQSEPGVPATYQLSRCDTDGTNLLATVRLQSDAGTPIDLIGVVTYTAADGSWLGQAGFSAAALAPGDSIDTYSNTGDPADHNARTAPAPLDTTGMTCTVTNLHYHAAR